MRAAVLATAVLTATALAPATPAAAAEPLAFTHPGVLVSRAQLDTMRQKVTEGAEPWASAYSAMRASNYASLSWTPKPRAIVECGPSSNPNHGCSDERNDAVAAYTHALLWYITRDARHARKSAQIMDAWSAVIQDHTNHNARLQTGWAGASWTRAGELVRHTYTGWPADRVNRFATMLRDVYLPEIRDGSPNTNGNWELIMMDAMIGIGVFNNDTTTFNRAIDIWRGRVPAYIYLRSDGQYPKSPPGSNKDTPAELIDYWQDQSTFVDGLAQETCRDFGHTGWGFAAAAHVAETAWHQGIDLYGEMRERMTKALEFHANYERGASVPGWLCDGSLDTGLGPTLEVAHNHYRNRTDTRLPTTLRVIQPRRPMGVSHFLAWETLTHAINPGTAPASAGRVITVSSIAELQSAADRALPGDRIELVDGVYTTSGPITLRRSGSAEAPVTIAAQRVGGAELRGSAGFSFAGADHVVVSGFRLAHGGSVSIPADSHHVRFSRNVVRLTSEGNWVTVVGNDVEVDHNAFQHKGNRGVFLQISGPGDSGMAQRTRVHHNYFADHTFSGDNGGESIRLGLSFRQLSSARAVIEYNLFERANGDSEAISVKSADNVVRFNTIRDSRGSIVLRHGNRNRVEGNLMLGGTAGIRFYDNDHVVINNLVQGGTGQIIAGSGTIADDTTGSTAHARPDRVLVAFNTVVGNRTNLLQVGQGTDRLGPNDCTFANNIFVVGGGSGALLDIDEATGARWEGNIVWAGTGGNAPSSGYRVVNPALVTDPGGLRRLSAGSPAINAAAGDYPQVTRDLDLQARPAAKDAGADEHSTDGPLRRPLTTADVGPTVDLLS